jgi:FKBP-type peptidyl-prolyl cis-trans isomerase FklB
MKKLAISVIIAISAICNTHAEDKIRLKSATLDRFNIYATELCLPTTTIRYFDITHKSYHGGESFGIMLPSTIERKYLQPDSLQGVQLLCNDISTLTNTAISPASAAYIYTIFKQSIDNKGNIKDLSELVQIDAAFYSDEDRRYLNQLDLNTTIHRTRSGLRYQILHDAIGPKPTDDCNVIVAYRGMHTDGKVFDENNNADFPIHTLIDGLIEGLCLMSEGATYRFYLPSNLAYGNIGYGDYFHPGEPLIFEFTLLHIH